MEIGILTVFAHQGGWDEMLMVATPIAVFAFLLKLANKRAKAAQAARLEAESASVTEGPSSSAPDAT